MTSIPVLVHHESNAKYEGNKEKTKKTQSYVMYCIKQAKKFNKKVILFGDVYNRGFSEEWFDASSFSNEKWERFLEVFENMSYYPLSWAESFFKRFYLFEHWMQENKINECIVLDSDILVYRDFSDGMFEECDVALEIEQDQSMPIDRSSNDLMWTAAAGVAYFTIESLKDFTSFCIDMYKNQKSFLKQKWDIHLKYNLPGGVCEMSLLYLWYQKRKNVFRFINLFCERKNSIGCLVANGNGDAYLKNVYDADKMTKLLKINWKSGVPYVIEKKSGKEIKLDSIHFGGGSKILMRGICKHERYTILNYLGLYCQYLRNGLRDLINKNTSRSKK